MGGTWSTSTSESNREHEEISTFQEDSKAEQEEAELESNEEETTSASTKEKLRFIKNSSNFAWNLNRRASNSDELSTRIFQFAEDHPLQRVQELYLCDNRTLSQLPSNIIELTCLTVLNISRNSLSSLPDAIGSLQILEKLIISENCITHFPNSLSNHHHLKCFAANKNKLKSFPTVLLSIETLESIDLRDNELHYVPQQIAQLKSLKKLRLSLPGKFSILPIEILPFLSCCDKHADFSVMGQVSQWMTNVLYLNKFVESASKLHQVSLLLNSKLTSQEKIDFAPDQSIMHQMQIITSNINQAAIPFLQEYEFHMGKSMNLKLGNCNKKNVISLTELCCRKIFFNELRDINILPEDLLQRLNTRRSCGVCGSSFTEPFMEFVQCSPNSTMSGRFVPILYSICSQKCIPSSSSLSLLFVEEND